MRTSMWPKSQTVSVACHWSLLCCHSTGEYRQDDLDIVRLCYLAWSIDVIEEVEEVCTFVLSLILFSMCLIKALSSLPYLAKKNWDCLLALSPGGHALYGRAG